MRAKPKQLKWFGAKGSAASKLRRRKFALVRRFGFPNNLLPGSLCQSYRRCGKDGCHCAEGEGHPMWSLTLSLAGKKHVEPIPVGWVTELQSLVEGGRRYREALREVLTLNAELLRLYRQQERKRRSAKSTSAGKKASTKRKKRSTRRR
jgi:hypothetical protein